MTQFNWLHLTDLHFGLSGQAPLWPNVKQAFFEDLATIHAHTGPWNVVLFSGDFVQQGSREEFEKLNEQVIHPLWERMKELGSTPYLLAVPGNHDLIRPQGKKSAAQRQMLKKNGFVEIADEFFDEPNGEYRIVVSASFKEYAAWWENAPFRHPDVRPGALPGDFSLSIEIDAVRIGVVGLNTTFLQLDGGDFTSRLAWDVRQFHAATTGKLDGDGPAWVKGHDVCLLMTHQGPEWLDDHSRDSVYPEINPAGRFAVHLFGHMHENIVRGTSSNGGEMLWHWQGNSLFGMEKYGDPPKDDRRHGYSAGRIQVGARSTTLRHWPRRAVKDTSGWRIGRDTQGCKLIDADGGTKAVDLPVHKRKHVRQRKKSVKVETGPQPIPLAYIQWLTDQCADITPLGMKPTPGQSVCLQQVYVPPVTTKRMDSEVEDIQDADAQETVGKRRKKGREAQRSSLMARGVPGSESSLQLLLHRLGEQSLYVSGDPGTGKSTFCRWVSWLAATGNDPSFVVAAPDGFQETLPESLRDLLPVVVRLREFAEYIPGQAGRRILAAGQLQAALENWLNQTKPGGLNWNAVGPRLKHGSVLLILDGVDELPLSAGEGAASWSPRECLITGLTAAATEWQTAGNRILVTSRPYGLEPDQVRALDRCGLPEARMENLPEPLQDLLATRWFVALPKPDRDGTQFAGGMLRDVRTHSQDLSALVRNPLLLTAICIIYDQGQKLPDDIHDLYDQIVSASLHSRYPRNPPDIAKFRFRLGAVALGMHTGNPFEPNRSIPSAEVSLPELDEILALHLGANPLSESGFCDQIAAREDLLCRSGLLTQGSSQRASFFHLSFQEFLAAEQLTRLINKLEELLQAIVQHSKMANWRPTLRFLLSRRVTEKSPEAVLELLHQMLKTIDVDDVGKFTGLTLSVVDGLEILLDRKLQLQGPVRDQFVSVFLKAIEQNIEVKARAELALMLGRLGDPRVPESLDDSNAWVTVPAGNYIYGDKNETILIERPFGLSKFPITNAQFASFVADGYQDESLWHPAGWAWRTSNNVTQPEYWDNSKWNGATCPVVGVSWWEADAFCRWAEVRLPGEREWEAAARGPKGFEYPWDNTWKEGLCNSDESGLNRTSPVGIFPQSASFCGAHDMAGNVWEWSVDHYNPAEQNDNNAGRVLRGGSWGLQAGDCRSSIRVLNQPGSRGNDVGFRVARTL